jgi:hypothetical protein
VTLDRDAEEAEAALAWWHELSDMELLRRLIQRGLHPTAAGVLAYNRERAPAAVRITELLGVD